MALRIKTTPTLKARMMECSSMGGKVSPSRIVGTMSLPKSQRIKNARKAGIASGKSRNFMKQLQPPQIDEMILPDWLIESKQRIEQLHRQEI